MALLKEIQGSFASDTGLFENTTGLFCRRYKALLQKMQGSFQNTTGFFGRYKALLQEIQASSVGDYWLVKIRENLA